MEDNVKSKVGKSSALLALEEVGQILGLAVEEDCNRYEIKLPDHFAKGKLLAYEDNNGISAFIFKAMPKNDWMIEFDGSTSKNNIFFYTLAKGSISVDSGKHTIKVDDLQGAIHGGFGLENYQLGIKAGQDVFGMIVMLNKTTFLDQIACDELEVPQDLLNELAKPTGGSPQFFFKEIKHLPLIETLQEIVNQPVNGLINTTFAMGKIYENIYLQLKIYNDWSQGKYNNNFRENQKIEMLKNAEDILSSRIKNPPTIPELSKMVGTNMQTLKQGFRQLYGKTINQYVNEKRMDQAKLMMVEGRMTLAEIAEAVGYRSGSYFSKRFKEFYGVKPSMFFDNGSKESKL